MKCPICKHGQTQPGLITVTLDRDGATVVFKGVPAEVCDNCGEEFVDSATTAELLKQAEVAVKSGIQVQVRAYAA